MNIIIIPYLLTIKLMNASFIDRNWKEKKRTHCSIYTRTMWYYRPVSYYNDGKKSEHYSRTHFTEEASINSEFIKKFA